MNLTTAEPGGVSAIGWDDDRVRRQRLERLQAFMKDLGIGAMYLYDVNMRYALNLRVPGANVFVPAEGEPTAFVRGRDIVWVSECVPAQRLLYEGTSMWDPRGTVKLDRFGKGIADLMGRHGVAGKPLAVDTLETAAVLALLEAGIHVVDATGALEQARSVKTDDEVALYRAMGDMYTHVIGRFQDAVRPGVTESELSGVVSSAWYEVGGEDASHVELCAGDNMNPWRRWPSQRAVLEGDLVGVDFHGVGPRGLRGDVSRTVLCGERPSQAQRDLYRRAHEFLLGVIATMRAGRSFAEVYSLVPGVPTSFQSRMLPYPVFHCIGMTPAGYPSLDRDRPAPDAVLKPNQVFAVESYFGEEGSPIAVKLEDQVLVRDGEPEVLGASIPFDDRLLA